jgi:hypothetical protein
MARAILPAKPSSFISLIRPVVAVIGAAQVLMLETSLAFGHVAWGIFDDSVETADAVLSPTHQRRRLAALLLRLWKRE